MKHENAPEHSDEQAKSPIGKAVPMNQEAALRAALAFRAEMLTLKQVEQILNISRTKLHRLRKKVKKDPLPQHNLDGTIRINRGELEDWRIRRKI
jgi:Helix-turn-helix domain